MRTYPVPNEHGMTPHYAVKVRLAKGGTLLTGVLPRKARHGGMTRNSASFRVFTRNSLGRFFQMSLGNRYLVEIREGCIDNCRLHFQRQLCRICAPCSKTEDEGAESREKGQP